MAEEIIYYLTLEQANTFERLKYKIATESAKVAFTISIGDAAQRALAARPPCECNRRNFCYREQLAAIAPRFQHNAEVLLPVLDALYAKSTRGRACSSPEGPCK